MAEPKHRISDPLPYPYAGPDALARPIEAALRRVIDPEMALDVVSLGLIYGVAANGASVKVILTMTSAACPVAELIIEDIGDELLRALGDGVDVDCDLVWNPPWSPERMGAAARSAMGWD